MGSNSKQVSEIPKVDLTGLQPSLAGGEQWKTTRAAVAEALQSYGCFEAVYPSLSPEIRDAMFGNAVPQLFSLPLETKLRSASGEPYHGYIGQIPQLAYESLAIDKANSPIAIQDFTQVMWPEGNSTFSILILAYLHALSHQQHVGGLCEAFARAGGDSAEEILESLGVEKYNDSLSSSITHRLRLSEYGVPLNQETKMALDAHVDPNLLTVVCQHKIDGLEVQTIDGTWINVKSSPTSVVVMVGHAFQAWSNMKVRAPMHRVSMFGNEKRFSVLYASRPNHNSIVKTPEELGDDEHPLLYKPFNYTEFVRFLYSEQGLGNKDAFNAYCRITN